VIALGETMMALAVAPGESFRTADAATIDHAGAETNTCIGLARLGFKVAWVSRLGMDSAGDRVLAAVAAEGVDTSLVVRDPQRRTGLMLKDGSTVCYYRRESAASAMTAADAARVPVDAARAVLVTGVTALIGAGPHAAGVELLSRARGLRVVDPNLRDGLWGSPRRAALVRAFVTRCDLLLGGAGELRELAGGAGDEDVARQAAACGPREIVVRGERAIGVLRDGAWRTVTIDRGDSIDPIGAGDAFNAGYLAVRLRDGSIDDALRAGIRCGAAVTTTPSDTSAFPRSLA
jgi:2-dehydro-3-deoxygluconokinase